MSPSERNRAFIRARNRVAREEAALMRATREELVRLLKAAQAAIGEALAAQPTEYERWSLPQLRAEVERVLAEFERQGAAAAARATGRAWELGEELVTAPLEAAGVRASGVLARIDTRQLQALRVHLIDRVRDIGTQAGNKIVAELGLVVIGARSPHQAIGAVRAILGEASRVRATTIVRTELGRAYSHAAQERMAQAAQRLPGLKKQWRRSGKLHARLHHDLADGQVVAVDKPFVLKPFGRPAVELMFPRDPAAPAAETINCGCVSLPIMEHWKVRHPGRTPGSPLLDGDDETLREILARQPERAAA